MLRIQSSDRCAVDMKPMAPSIRVRSTRIALLIANLGSNIGASCVQYSPAAYWCQLAASSLPRALYSHAPEYVSPIRGVLLRGVSHEPKDVFSRALFPNARGALVSEGVLHVGVMGVALCREGGNPALSLGSAVGFSLSTQQPRLARCP